MMTDALQTAPTDLRRNATDWVRVAESLYSFNHETAQRLAFVRWLRTTGRLRGDDAAETETAPASLWHGI